MWASKGGHTEIVLLLLEHLAEINIVNVVGCVLLLSQQKYTLLLYVIDKLRASAVTGYARSGY